MSIYSKYKRNNEILIHEFDHFKYILEGFQKISKRYCPNNTEYIQKYEIDNTCLCIIKTVWIKIFQRKYKNYYNKKMNYYKNPKNIMNRKVYGKWV